FLGVWFFLTLAPASSFIPLAFTARDRRMILPMAALAVLAVAGSWSLGRRFSEKRGLGLGGAVLVACLAVSLGAATWVRNLDYASATSIWRDTVEKAPENYRAWVALGQAFQAERNREEARRAADKALALRPDLALAWVLSGSLYWDENRAAEAEQAWLMALEREPEHFAQANLSTVYLSQGRFDEAIRRAEAALARRPDYYPARMNLGMALAGEARLGEAEEILAGLVRTHPRAETFFGMGRVLDLQGRPGEAAAWYARALEAQPAHQEARLGLATVLSRQGRLREAVALYREVLEQSPDRPDVLVNLGRVFALLGRVPEAREEFQKALDLDPGNPVALSGLEGLDAGGP
ncbi:MAG: tetratricopeptide repeat protein, partial [Proteobacteria bacterium]|nr:tetratricopeptide repeat protein [Pseudomonadota bacterium]